ncbi:MAG: DUF4105 domain-containing protein [Chitinophagaceae bacterium]|nr:DUF4105 domain-containing protein [Chitinophagaceae bacterium]
MKKLLFFFFFLNISHTGVCDSFPDSLSSQSVIRIVTFGPSEEELYLAFGHSAVWVKDSVQGLDIVFHYGVFDFQQPHFYLNFARGKLLYKMGVNYYQDFKNHYIGENRSIIYQELNLTGPEKNKLYASLLQNYLPENREYYYNYVTNNCATKIRDVLHSVFQDSLQFTYPFIKKDISFRKLIDIYLPLFPWGDLGIDVSLGSGIDHIITGYDYMFLPDYIFAAFAKATLYSKENKKTLISKTESVYTPFINRTTVYPMWKHPIVVFGILVVIIHWISFLEYFFQKRYRAIDFVTFLIPGLLGVYLFFLAFFTDHTSQYNFNMLWACPIYIPVAFFMLQKRNLPWLQYGMLLNGVFLFCITLFGYFLFQKIDILQMPFLFLFMIRSFLYFLR